MKVVYPPPFSRIGNETATRTFDTVYQNTTGKILLVAVSLAYNVSVAGGAAWVKAECAEGSNPGDGDIVGRGGLYSSPIAISYSQVTIVVPPSWYYVIRKIENNGVVTENVWIEVY